MDNQCEWNKVGCQNYNIKCQLCLIGPTYYKEPKQITYGLQKKINVSSKRQGNAQEVKVFNQTREAVSGTPNSGAGSIKGDLEIENLAMIECKTTTKKNEGRQPGKESFSIQRNHLEKLKAEALGKKEFHYLVFSFKEHDNDQYAVTDLECLNSMIATIRHDRKAAQDVNNQIDVYKKRYKLIEAENFKLSAEIDLLKAILKREGIENE